MPKPIVVAKREGPEWCVVYTDDATHEENTMSVFGSPTIEDALQEARSSLNANRADWYTIVGIELINEALAEDEP